MIFPQNALASLASPKPVCQIGYVEGFHAPITFTYSSDDDEKKDETFFVSLPVARPGVAINLNHALVHSSSKHVSPAAVQAFQQDINQSNRRFWSINDYVMQRAWNF